MTDPPVLVELRRGDRVESVHRGRAVLRAPGSPDTTVGDVREPIYPRSALKPLQAAGMLDAGGPSDPGAVALSAASHAGAAIHRDGVRAILAAAGFTPEDLGCPPDLPLDEDVRAAYLAAGGLPDRLAMNCSGKHAAMLATCRGAGWDPLGYLDRSHALQRRLEETIEQFGGEAVAASSVDGCGAPAHALSLAALARGFARLAAGSAVAEAMRARPELVSGTGRPVTELMAAVPGLIAKDGAEGVWAMALPDGRACALKIDDGASRALAPLAVAVLRRWNVPGADADVLARWAVAPVLGGGRPVGSVAAVATFPPSGPGDG